MNEMIFKELAIDTIMSQPTDPHYPSWYAELIRNMSPVEPNLDEWCTGCKEYDSEHHCCPRFNRVIRETLEEVKAEHQKSCDYWDTESNYCTLNRPTAQPEHKKIAFLLEELSKKSPMVIATAYLYAINYTSYGEDVTEKWLTALQNSSALEKAYRKGYGDAMQRQTERSKNG